MVEVSLFGLGGEFEDLARSVEYAEELGFDGYFTGEHHGSPGIRHPQSLILLAGLAARTSRIKLGTSILLSPLYHPIHLAESVAMLDGMSGGRFILGVGIGYQPQDFNHFGLPIGQRVSRFEECLEVMRLAWSDGPFSYSGKRFQFRDVDVHPKPITKPHPAIWAAAWTEPGAVRAGCLADAYVTDPIQNLAATKHFVEFYRKSAEEHGRVPRVVLMREFLCAASRSEAEDRYGERLLATYRYYWRNGAFNAELEPWVKEIRSPEQISFGSITQDRVIWGTPDDCVGQLEHWVNETGAEHVELAMPGEGGPFDVERQLEAIQFTGERVLPALHRLRPAASAASA